MYAVLRYAVNNNPIPCAHTFQKNKWYRKDYYHHLMEVKFALIHYRKMYKSSKRLQQRERGREKTERKSKILTNKQEMSISHILMSHLIHLLCGIYSNRFLLDTKMLQRKKI